MLSVSNPKIRWSPVVGARLRDQDAADDGLIARIGTLRNEAAGSSVLVSWLAPTLSLRCSFEVLSAPRTPAH